MYMKERERREMILYPLKIKCSYSYIHVYRLNAYVNVMHLIHVFDNVTHNVSEDELILIVFKFC